MMIPEEKVVRDQMVIEEDTLKNGYHLIAYRHHYEECDQVVEFYDDSQVEELEAKIQELLSRKYEGFEEEDIRVIHGVQIPFMATKEVVTGVKIHVR